MTTDLSRISLADISGATVSNVGHDRPILQAGDARYVIPLTVYDQIVSCGGLAGVSHIGEGRLYLNDAGVEIVRTYVENALSVQAK